jgi:UDP-N-acetylglucosamine 2-epimerase (non-hydrolysing)
MKIKPVMDALERRGVETVLVHAGQHYDADMSQVFFDDLGLREPDHWLGVGSGSHAEQTARVLTAFEPLVQKIDPDIVVVVGDVNATLGCALVAAKSACSLAHVEAGLRSFDLSMPEEVNRIVTDRVSDLLFAPSADAVDNLRAEGVSNARVHLVGNVMVDTLRANLDRATARPILADLGLVTGGYGLVTLHRPVSVDDPSVLGRLVEALGRVAADIPLVFPVHPRARLHLDKLGVPPGLRLMPPAGYLDFLALEAGARLVITDSGGVQEETTVLGVPCLTVRDTTERPITVSKGTNTIVGLDPARLVAEAKRALTETVITREPPLWDGHAADRIADVLVEGLGSNILFEAKIR